MKRMTFVLWLLQLFILANCTSPSVDANGAKFVPDVSVSLVVDSTMRELLKKADHDSDHKITIHDGTNLEFDLIDSENSQSYLIRGHYPLSILLQDLAQAKNDGLSKVSIKLKSLFEDPTVRTGRLIRESYWDGLTRRLDAEGLPRMLDTKTGSSKGGELYLYLPKVSPDYARYYSEVSRQLQKSGVHLHVELLASNVTPDFVRGLDQKPGILGLDLDRDSKGRVTGAKPFVVPGGRFNEMYGWDSYFIILGLIADGKIELAKAQVDNLLFEITHYGKILNANRTYYLTRSQPPFTTSAIRAVYDRLPQNEVSKTWFQNSMLAALTEYRNVWMRPPHLVESYGLSRYFGLGSGPCPEVEPGHYDREVATYLAGLTMDEVNKSYGRDPNFQPPDRRLDEFFKQDRALRESGHDTTYRFDDRATDFLTVDLNSLLFKTETDFASAVERGELDAKKFGSATDWGQKAELRRKRMIDLMYDPATGLFYDYDVGKQQRSTYLSATAFYVLWAKIVDTAEARRLATSAMRELLQPGGLAATSLESMKKAGRVPGVRQWDYPYGWAPHQMLAWQGLTNYGLNAEARELASRWIKMIADNARDFNGTVPEKFNVVTKSHEVFAEYGNVGTQFDYITKEGFGWMNASFQVGTQLLRPLPAIKR